jgi:hypothetical protein
MDNDYVEKLYAVIHENHRLTVCQVSEEVDICKMIHENRRRLTVREVSEVDISKILCHTILTEKLEMHRVAAKFVRF